MSLELKITTALKEAMKSKNQTALTALRAVKSAILLHKTQKSSDGELSQEDEMKLLQKLVKQRKDSADIYICLLYTSPSPRDLSTSRMPSSA